MAEERFDLKKLQSNFVDMVVDNSPLAYVIMDRDRNVVYANNFVYQILGYTNDEVVGKKCYDFVNGGVPCSNCALKKALAFGTKASILKEEYSKSGDIKYSDITAVPLYKPDGTFDYIMEIVQDRTYEVRVQRQTEQDFYALVKSFSGLVEANSDHSGNHAKNVKDISLMIADSMNLREQSKRELFVGAYLHDVGKIAIPESIISKPDILTPEEYDIVKKHPVVGGNILKNMSSFKNVNAIVRNHHERYDGGGYPDGLKGDEIPLLARIVCVADSFDAMTTNRMYRQSMTMQEAKNELIANSGTQFDPKIVDVFVKLIDAGQVARQNDIFIEESAAQSFDTLRS